MKTNFDGINKTAQKQFISEIDTHESWWTKASPYIAGLALFLALFGSWIVDYFTR